MSWFRFDPERNERRHVTVAAYTRKREFNRAFRELADEIERRKSSGLSEEMEHPSGVHHKKGYLADMKQMRLEDRRRRQSW